MPSVTEILETFPEAELVAWKLRVGAKKVKEVSEEALRIGTVVDKIVQAECRMEQVELPPEASVENCFRAWRNFLKESPSFPTTIVWMQQELSRFGITGHPDFYLKRGSAFGICDLKCASQIRPLHWTQVAAYSWLQHHETNADFLAILRLDKQTGNYEYVELTEPDEIDYEVQVWLNYKTLYEHRQQVATRSRTMKEDEAYDGVS